MFSTKKIAVLLTIFRRFQVCSSIKKVLPMSNITVTFRTEYGVDLGRSPPHSLTLNIPQGCTVFNLIQIAQENSARHSFKYRTFPDIGAEVTTIDEIDEDPLHGIYWFFYSPWNKLIPSGVSSHKITHNTTVIARYERWTRTDHSKQKAPRREYMLNNKKNSKSKVSSPQKNKGNNNSAKKISNQ